MSFNGLSPWASQGETGNEGASTRPPQSGPRTLLGCRGPPPNSAVETVEPRKRYTSVTLQDARLLVEAMSSSVEQGVFSSQQGMKVKPVCGPSVGAQQTADRALQIRPHSSTCPKAVHSLIIKEVSAAESSQETINVTQPSETESQIRASSAATAAAVQPHGSSSLKTFAPGKEVKRVPQKIIVLPRLAVSLQNCDRAKQHPILVSAAAAKVDTAKNTGNGQTSATPCLIPSALTTSSVPVKTPFILSNTSLPVTETTIFGELPSGDQQQPRIKIVIPVQKTVERQPESEKSDQSADHFLPQEEKLPLESPTPPDMVPTVPQVEQEYSESSLSLNCLAGLKVAAALHIKPFAVVKLTRLPFYMSTEESVLISRLPLGAGGDSHSVPNEDTRSSRPSSESPSVITSENIVVSSTTGSPSANVPQDEVTWETGQPIEQKTSSKDQEKVHQFYSLHILFGFNFSYKIFFFPFLSFQDSTSCTETGSSESIRTQEDDFKVQRRNGLKSHLKVGSTSYQHAETPTVNHKKPQKDQKDSKINLDLAEIAEAVSTLRANRDFTLQTSESGLSCDVPEPPTTIQTTTLYTRVSSPVRNDTMRNTKPGLGHSDANVSPRSLRRTGSSPDTGKPKRPKSDIISKTSDSSVISSPPKTREEHVHETCSSVQLGSSVEDSKKRSIPSGRRKNDEGDTNFKSAKKSRIMQAEMTPQTNLKVRNAKKLAKKAKAKLVKKKASRRLLQKRAKATWLEANPPSSVAVKKIRSSGVWIPPVGDARENEPEPAKPPRVSVPPVTVRAAPVVSPLQPLSLIGTRLLKNQCGVCGQVLGSSSALESHVSLHTRQPFSCRLCGKIFPDTKALKRHDRVHRNGKIHVCQKCGKAFVYKFSLSKHLEMVHRRIKPFVCQICSKSFFTKLDVESHIRIHTGEKPFQCDLCERKFIRRVDLNVHLRWHNGEKRHWCPYCKKGFLDFNNLKRHKYIHTGEKPHPCTHCPKQFTQSAHLKKHLKNVHKIADGS